MYPPRLSRGGEVATRRGSLGIANLLTIAPPEVPAILAYRRVGLQHDLTGLNCSNRAAVTAVSAIEVAEPVLDVACAHDGAAAQGK